LVPRLMAKEPAIGQRSTASVKVKDEVKGIGPYSAEPSAASPPGVKSAQPFIRLTADGKIIKSEGCLA